MCHIYEDPLKYKNHWCRIPNSIDGTQRWEHRNDSTDMLHTRLIWPVVASLWISRTCSRLAAVFETRDWLLYITIYKDVNKELKLTGIDIRKPEWKIYRFWIIVKAYWVFDVLDVKTDNYMYFELHNVVLTASKFFRHSNMSLWNQKHRVKPSKVSIIN